MTTVNTVMLSFVEEEILRHLSLLVEREIAEAQKIILFGSRARGESDEESDMDVAIVVNVTSIDSTLWERLWDIKWRVLESLNSEEFPLSLTIITMSDFIGEISGLIKEIKREGVLVWERN
ncbi:MAG: hypothetical protein OHK0032_02590 [Thermodesulfovibrionales bacterium]